MRVLLLLLALVAVSSADWIKRPPTNSLFVGGDFLWTSNLAENGTVVGGVAQWKLGNSSDASETRFVLELLGGGVHHRPGLLNQIVAVPNANNPSLDDLFIAGDFHRISNQISLFVARFDGSTHAMSGMGGGLWQASPTISTVARLTSFQTSPDDPVYIVAAGNFHYQTSKPGVPVNNILRWDPRAKEWSGLPVSINQNEADIPCTSSISDPTNYHCNINSIAVDQENGLICVAEYEAVSTRILCYDADVLKPYDSPTSDDYDPFPSPSPTPTATKPKKSSRDSVSDQYNWIGGIWSPLTIGSTDIVMSDSLIMRFGSKEMVYAIVAKKKSNGQSTVNLQRWSSLSPSQTFETKSMWENFCYLDFPFGSTMMMPLITSFQNGVLVAYAASNITKSSTIGYCTGDLSFYYQSDKDSLTGKKTDNPTLPPSIPMSKVTSLPQQMIFQNNVLFISDQTSVLYWDSKRSKSWQTIIFPAPYNNVNQLRIGKISFSPSSNKMLISACLEISTSPWNEWHNIDLQGCKVFQWDPVNPTVTVTLLFDQEQVGLRQFGSTNAIIEIPSNFSDYSSSSSMMTSMTPRVPAAVFVGGDFSEGGFDSSSPSTQAMSVNNGALWTGTEWVDLGINNNVKFLDVDSLIFADSEDPSTRKIQLYAIATDASKPFLNGEPLPFYRATIYESQLQPDTIQSLGNSIVWQLIPGVWKLDSDFLPPNSDFYAFNSIHDVHCDQTSHIVYFSGLFLAKSPNDLSETYGVMGFDAKSESWFTISTPLFVINSVLTFHDPSSDLLIVSGYNQDYDYSVFTLDVSQNYSVVDANPPSNTFTFTSTISSLVQTPTDVVVLGLLPDGSSPISVGAMRYNYAAEKELTSIGAPATMMNKGVYSTHFDQLFVGSRVSGGWPYGLCQLHDPSGSDPQWQILGASTLQLWSGSVNAVSFSLSIDDGPFEFLLFDGEEPFSPSNGPPPGPPGPTPGNGDDGLSTGEIIGISIAVCVTVVFLVVLVVVGFIVYKKRQEEEQVEFI